MLIAFLLVVSFVLIKFKPAYVVVISDTVVGYISNKSEFQNRINNEILNSDEENVAFVEIEEMPQYMLFLIGRDTETSEDKIFEMIKEKAVTTYKIYAIAVNDENITYVNSLDEAETAIAEIKEAKENKLDEINIEVRDFYTTDIEELQSTTEVETAIDEAELKVEEIVAVNKKIKASTLDGVYFSTKPVAGNITSRYGATEDIRSHAHSGLDIAAPAGTEIMAAADGTVTFSGVSGGYGNLIIITHESGIQTYYGHCSKLYASVGDEVKAGDVIAAVGMTGQATGNHLHFEIRKNGSTLNPQKYLYN